jgi:hypothetical protein
MCDLTSGITRARRLLPESQSPLLLQVCFWHETDMPTALRDVRSQGQSGKHLLALSFSGFDPPETLAGSKSRNAS